MRIVDAHHHLWDPVSKGSGVAYSWLHDIGAPKPFGDPTPIQRDYLAPEYLAESAHEIAGTVHVQADGGIADPVSETVWLDRVADESGIPGAIVGFVDLATDGAARTIERHVRASPRFRGVRQIIARTAGRPEISFAARELLEDATWRANYAELARFGLSFDLQLHPAQMEGAVAFLANHADVPVVIDHAGSPHDQSPGGLERWARGMRRLAELPHAHAKLSGLGMFDAAWTERTARPIVETILDAFGSERTMFGSNFPVDKLFAPYDAAVDRLRAVVPAEDRDGVFRTTATAFYRLPA